MIIKPKSFREPNLDLPICRGLVGFWLMNEGGGTTVADLSGNGNNGNLDNTATFISGNFGPAVEIGDGSDGRISCPSFTPLVNDFTMVVWARLDADKANGVVMDQAGGARCVITSDVPFTAKYYDGVFNTITSTISHNLGTWNQFVFVKSSVTGAQLFLNGNLVATEAGYTSNVTPLAYLCFGSASNTLGNATYTIDGAIDHGLIYNRALSASEIALLYREPLCMFEEEPIELWSAATQGVTGNAGIMTCNTGFWGATY